MIIVITCVIAFAVLAFVLRVRPQDLPAPQPVSPFAHLDERKVAIYENLRDLQFEYRVGKMSDEDYQSMKQHLQKELAAVLAEVDRVKTQLNVNGAAPSPAPAKPESKPASNAGPTASPLVCPTCGAKFDKALKFCGECGKPMKAVGA